MVWRRKILLDIKGQGIFDFGLVITVNVAKPVDVAFRVCRIEANFAELAPGIVWVRSNAMDGDDAELMSELCMHIGDVIAFG